MNRVDSRQTEWARTHTVQPVQLSKVVERGSWHSAIYRHCHMTEDIHKRASEWMQKLIICYEGIWLRVRFILIHEVRFCEKFGFRLPHFLSNAGILKHYNWTFFYYLWPLINWRNNSVTLLLQNNWQFLLPFEILLYRLKITYKSLTDDSVGNICWRLAMYLQGT